MGKQSARIRLNGKDHKEIKINGKYHKLADRDSNVLWEKIAEEPIVYDGFKMQCIGSVSFNVAGNGVIDWGDGKTQEYSTPDTGCINVTHSYSDSVSHEVIVSGDVKNLDFKNCRGIGKIKTPLPPTMKWKTDFSYMFSSYNFSGLVIPSDLFKYCVNAENFDYCFYDTMFYRIPVGLFDNCKKAKTFRYCFWESGINVYEEYCIPPGLFKNNTLATDFSGCFYNWNSYLILGTDMFANCVSAENLTGCFMGTHIEALDANLFKDMVNLKYLHRAFYNCTYLMDVPYGLFDNCPNLIDVGQAFYNCKRIETAVPPLWEREWEKEEYYRGCYYNCTNADKTGLTDGMWIADVS